MTVSGALAMTLADEWPEPLPLDRGGGPQPYPLDALPGEIGEAVAEYLRYGQQPPAIVASSALAAVSLAVQGLADVARDDRLVGPVSLSFLTIAKSGERKSGADKEFKAAIREWERDRRDALKPSIKAARIEHEKWEAERDAIKAQLRRADGVERELVAEGLRQHLDCEPVIPIPPRRTYEDMTPEALANELATGYPSAALWSDEGGVITGGRGMGRDSMLSYLASLSRLWDGGDLHQIRKQAGSVHVEGRRLTVNLMIQPDIWREFMDRSGSMARGSGFAARYLVSAPVSTQGRRPYTPPPAGGLRSVARFKARLRVLLDLDPPLDAEGRLAPPVLPLTREAFDAWRRYHDETEIELGGAGAFADVPDFASKSAEQAARLAACLHIFASGPRGEIGPDNIRRGVRIARWHLRESLRLFAVMGEPVEWQHARMLEEWLAAHGGRATASEMARRGPNSIREQSARKAAAKVLTLLQRAEWRQEADGCAVLIRNPRIMVAAHSARIANPANSANRGTDDTPPRTLDLPDSQNSQNSQPLRGDRDAGGMADSQPAATDAEIYGPGVWLTGKEIQS